MRSSPNILHFQEIRERWEQQRAEGVALRSRDFASELGIQEAELVGSGAGHRFVRFLDLSSVEEWLPSLFQMGSWMWLLRNDATVLEVDSEVSGNFRQDRIEIEGEALQIILDREKLSYALYLQPLKGPARSIQFYDTYGQAVLKIYLKDRERRRATDELLKPFDRDPQPEYLKLEAPTTQASNPPKNETGEILSAQDLSRLLETAVEAKSELQLKAVNSAGTLICRHCPAKVVPMNEWINILDPGMNLHARLDLFSKGSLQSRDDTFLATFLLQDGRPGLEIGFQFQFSLSSTR